MSSQPPSALHTGRLLLAPQDPWQAPELAPLRLALTQAGVLGARLDVEAPSSSRRAFALGEKFFHYVAFTGCAVNLTALSDGASCHLCLHLPQATPNFFAGRNTRPPRCPNCRHTLADWATQRATWPQIAAAALYCSNCTHTTAAWHWDWRGQAGFARMALSIEEVFPGEATPLPGLFELLHQASAGVPWQGFVVQQSQQ